MSSAVETKEEHFHLLQEKIKRLDHYVDVLLKDKEKHDRLDDLVDIHDKELEDLEEEHEESMEDMEEKHDNEREKLMVRHNKEMEELCDRHTAEVEEIEAEYEKQPRSHSRCQVEDSREEDKKNKKRKKK